MGSRRTRTPEIVGPLGANNLRSINGIGPAVEHRLLDAGIHTFAQLAAMSPEQIAAVVADLTGLSARRIVELDWIGQARDRAPAPVALVEETGALPGGQRQEIFTIHLVLNADNEVHHTRVENVRGGSKETWAGWQADRLTQFVVDQAALRVAPVEQALATTEGPAAAVLAPPPREGIARLRELTLQVAGTYDRRNSFSYGTRCELGLVLDMTEVATPDHAPIGYSAIVYAKKLDDRQRIVVGQATGTIELADRVELRMASAELSRGMYRFEAAVNLTLAAGAPDMQREMKAWFEGALVQIY
ncbi:MAG TPA: helix-hairpin-helix domain-containing protein [Roseiflexaceae bacterium]|nr:helix-hairpin-helix domain-containing protein [Roseiflexaceae bacterium]